MKTSDFDYHLPEELIAQTPMEPRDHSRLLVYNRADQSMQHLHFYDLPRFLRKGDVLVINETKVIPARLLGEKEDTGVPVELLLLKRLERDVWEALVRPGRRLKPGAICTFGGGLLKAEIIETAEDGGRKVRFHYNGVFEEILDQLGQMPLPPYIHEKLQDQTRYQTVYAREEGSAAAPTAGLHFTPELMERIRSMGVEIVPVVLHVGLGTFRPVKVEDVSQHHMHVEHYEVSPEAARRINQARANGGRCICVGTTSVRTLETVTGEDGLVKAQSGDTGIFIMPGYTFHATDALITNFHLPQSTLLMLISALMGREEALRVYEEAVRQRYRFFSFGDAMLIL
ncbi:MAG: tRNA preQ1(34) S-adenosylmethionine ribosyltransferase-isomerase QueA [Clostridiales bacterium]|nr:tRNA preQ1(34) S-adenosylmethionine ribosyltransferase-isomerase QueA [Clostridiales bacterium]